MKSVEGFVIIQVVFIKHQPISGSKGVVIDDYNFLQAWLLGMYSRENDERVRLLAFSYGRSSEGISRGARVVAF